MAKKNRLSRLLALFLALVMLLSVFPLQAFATEEETTETVITEPATDTDTLPDEKTDTKGLNDYEQMLDALPALVPVNEFVDLTTYEIMENGTYDRIIGLTGLYYFVTEKTIDGKLTYLIMDPSSPTIHQKVAATPVTILGNSVVGADPEMAIEVIHDTTTSGSDLWEHRLKLRGDYDDLESDYYLSPSYDDTTDSPTLVRDTGILDYGLVLRQGPGDAGKQSLGFYRNIKPEHFGSTDTTTIDAYIQYGTNAAGDHYFEMAKMPSPFGEGHLFKAYRVLTDRVNVENLLEMMESLREELTYNERYPQDIYDNFLLAFKEGIELYTLYNDKTLSGEELENKDAIQTQIDDLTEKLFSYRSQLRICRDTGNLGSEIRYNDATTLYRWDESGMNALTMAVEGGTTKGFFFTSDTFPEDVTIPLYSRWGWGSSSLNKPYTEALPNFNNKDASVLMQQYGIYSGLTLKDLDGKLDPLDPEVAVSANLWGTENIEGAKSVYTDIKMPFIYDVETGYYELNSDKNAVYFEGEPESGATVAIADLPASYHLNDGSGLLTLDPDTHKHSDPSTHGIYDRYITGFQPFSTVTDRLWKSFRGDIPFNSTASLHDSYLLDGIAWDSQAAPAPNVYEFGRGYWGFGMMMEIRFRMTESGTIIYEDAEGNAHEAPITFQFSGDDDIWVYIDDKLAMDLGGTHDAVQGEIDFRTGNVAISSDKYGRVMDKAGFYNQDSDYIKYEISDKGAIIGDGIMYEENIYTGLIEKQTAEGVADRRASTLGDGEVHVMRIYYMERGKGKTNCAIRFNLPQTDTLTVEKQINEYFEGNTAGEKLPEALYNNLRKKVYGFTLLENSKPCGNMPYYLMLNGLQVGSGVTSADGHFTLRGDQIAEFRSMDFAETKTYSVVEDDLSPLYWEEESYTYTYSGSDVAPAASGIGNSYAAPGNSRSIETLSFVCTNIYCHEVSLEPESQAVVLDYGKPIDVEVVRNAVITGASEIFVRQSKLLSVSFTNNADKSYGTLTKLDSDGDKKNDAFRFTLRKLLDKVLTITATVEVPFEDGSIEQVDIPVYLIPATQMYYETDFASNIFNLNVVGSDNLWQTIGTPQAEVQDDGNVGDQLYDFTIHKESIPSNAFFVDFDGTGMEYRYNKHPLYQGYDFDQENVWLPYEESATSMELNSVTGTLDMLFDNTKANQHRYAQTVLPNKTSFDNTQPLHIIPSKDHYVQARFRVENCVATTNTRFSVCFSNQTDAKCNRNAGSYANKDIVAEELLSGKFITVTIPLTDISYYTSATYIDAIQYQVTGINAADGKVGKVILDYLYIGPLTDENGVLGQAHETEGDALFFDFSNDTASQLRYQGTQYSKSGTVRNYDQKASWVSRYGKVNDTDADGSYSIDTTNGVYKIPVGDGSYTDGNGYQRYGPYFYMTADDGSHITFTDSAAMHQKWRLNYTIPEGNIYFHVGFRTTNVSFNHGNVEKDTDPYVQCTIAGYDTSGEHMADHPRMVYSASVLNSTTFYQGVLDITGSIRPATGLPMQTLQCLYIRFVHLYNAKDAGTVEIDYIYVGPESDPAKVRDMQNSNTVFIDFNNTNNDKQRYTSPMYSSVNHDIPGTWDTSWFTWDIKNGSAVLTPTAKQEDKADGYGSFFTKTSNLNYKMTGNDYIQIRFRIDNAEAFLETSDPSLCMYFGASATPVTSDSHVFHGYKPGDVLDQGWITYTYDISSYATKLDTLRFVFPAFFGTRSVDTANPATYTIDYIYVGPKVEGRPASQSLFFGFENEEIDQDRYDAPNYGYHNYDARNETTGPWKTDSDVSTGNYAYTIDNEAGILTLEVTNKLSTHNICGPYLTTSDLYNDRDNRDPNSFTVNFNPEHAEYMQIRFRTNDCQKADNAPRDMNVIFLYDGYDKDGNYVDYDTYNFNANNAVSYIRGYYEIEDGFQTLTMPLTEAIRDMLVISNFGIRFQHMSTRFDGSVDIDYIYVGPGELAPDPVYGYDSSYDDASYAEDTLFFGFGNGTGDAQRYDSEIYGSLNYDSYDPSESIGYWATSANTNAAAGDNKNKDYFIDNDAGIVHLNVRDGLTSSGGNPGPYLISTHRFNSYGFDTKHGTFHYPTEKAEVVQIRFKVVGCADPVNPSVIFLEGGLDADGTFRDYNALASDGKNHLMRDFFDVTGDWQVITCDVNENFHIIKELTNFGVRFVGFSGTDPEKDYIEIDYIYVGPKALAPANNYSHEAELSNGSSLFVQGSGVKTQSNTKTYTEASFTFTGTGFDIISRTGLNQATIRVEVQDAATGTVFKAMTVNNKGDMELSQIPVVSVHGLPHGSYTVYIWVNKAVVSTLPILSRGGDFFFDAVRIYDPVDVSKEAGLMTTQEKLSLDAYIGDKEAHDYVKEIRDILLSVADFNAVTFGNSTSGALFVDSVELDTPVVPDGTVLNPLEPAPTEYVDMVTDHLALHVKDYNKVGPKNEVYLSPGEAVVFKLVLSAAQKPVSIDIAAKTLLTDSGILAAGFVSSPSTSSETLNVLSRIEENLVTSTGMYYDLDVSTLPASGAVYLVIYNAYEGNSKTENIISITDLKVAYKEQPTEKLPEDDNTGTGDTEIKPEKRAPKVLDEPYAFTVDGRTLEAAAVFMDAVIESHKSETPILDQGTKIYHSLNLTSDIAINYLIKKSDLADYDSFSLQVEIPIYDENMDVGYRTQTIQAVDKGGDYYYFTLEGLTAVNMNDTIVATLHMEKDGAEYFSLTDEYSIGTYAYSQLNSATASAKLKALCAELLRYGASAQSFKGYRNDALVDSAMTAVHRSYLSNLDTVTFGNHNVLGTELAEPTVTWAGKALDLNSRVTVLYCVDLTNYSGDPAELTMKVTYTDYKGQEATVVLSDPAPYAGKTNCYTFLMDSLMAAELRTVLTARVYAGNTPISNSLTYSADTYGNNKTGVLGTLCKALFAFSDSAKDYFR